MNSKITFIVYDYILSFINENKFTEDDFCKACDISFETLQTIKLGLTDVSIKEVCKICSYIEVPLDRLVVEYNVKIKNSKVFLQSKFYFD